ncbi:hypothetical protein [Klebsiella pneumoniae]|uniref:hypothetical protein n=1 Tax=Klebsiella pneumoniae TaxID=573 RepID=UPI001CEF9A09|nr:hypothetical protein [Klebsiella pneumoniae]
MAAKNKAVEPEETGTQDNHATWSHRQSVNPLCSLGRTTVIPVEISRALKDRAPKNWLSGVSRLWPEDAERALKPKPGDSDFDTDIG